MDYTAQKEQATWGKEPSSNSGTTLYQGPSSPIALSTSYEYAAIQRLLKTRTLRLVPLWCDCSKLSGGSMLHEAVSMRWKL